MGQIGVGGGGGFAVPNKRRQKNECREPKDKRDLCYTLHTLEHKLRSKYSHKNYVRGNGKYEGNSSSFISGSFRITRIKATLRVITKLMFFLRVVHNSSWFEGSLFYFFYINCC
jgi:hypothetical protein